MEDLEDLEGRLRVSESGKDERDLVQLPLTPKTCSCAYIQHSQVSSRLYR